jgi:Ligand-gated ion channel
VVGGVCYPKKSTIRLVAGAWCLVAFVLVNSYSSTLISFVSASNTKPFIKSINDIPEKPGAHLVIERGKSAEVIFSVLNAFI